MFKRSHIKFIPHIFILYFVIVTCIATNSGQQFTYLSSAFLHHQVTVSNFAQHSSNNWALFNNRYSWPLGPFPAILLMPFVWIAGLFHVFFPQGYLQFLLVVATGLILVKLARKLKFDIEDSLILSLGFLLGSMYIGVSAISNSWFYAQVVTVLMVLLALYEYHARRRWLLIGMLCGAILLTRITALPVVLFFILEVFTNSKMVRKAKSHAVLKLILPIFFAALLLMFYNFLRFNSPFEQGYSYQILSYHFTLARSYGLSGLVHLPGNLYFALLSMPEPVFKDSVSHVLTFPFIQNNPWGMSIFVTSPYLLWLFSLRKKNLDKTVLNLLAATLVSAILIFTYYGVGYYQFGYRYALDFMPLLFLVFMIKYKESHKKITTPMKLTLLGSGILNFYLLIYFIGSMAHA